jgi:hypothetical protein
MWLALAAVTFATARGFNVLALALRLCETHPHVLKS